MALKLITPPSLLPVSLAEAKMQCRVDTADEDSLISGMIAAATDKAEHYTGRAIMAQTWELSLDAFRSAIELTRIPVANISQFTYLDAQGVEQSLSPSQYYLVNSDDFTSAYLVPSVNMVWPSTGSYPNACTVRFVAGYANASAVPPAIKQWVLICVAAMYEYREAYTEKELKLGYANTLLERYKVY
jgi:uncharacterized phiE125 gp8 family phage protein